jgi:hypothetical protein
MRPRSSILSRPVRSKGFIGIIEVGGGIWLVSFMRYDLGYIDLEQRTLQTIDNPFGTRLSPISPGGTRVALVPAAGLEPATP